MKQIWGNLATCNLDTCIAFYTNMGFTLKGQTKEMASFIFGENNFVINFVHAERLRKFIPNVFSTAKGTASMFSISVESVRAVDDWFDKVNRAGGKIELAPAAFEQGYMFSFSDPDGHCFNILYWPGM